MGTQHKRDTKALIFLGVLMLHGAAILLLLRATHQLQSSINGAAGPLMAPGIVWAHPRVEVDKDTLLPIIHINDHCVLILLFPFCGIGHIKPNSHLLDHLHDPVE